MTQSVARNDIRTHGEISRNALLRSVAVRACITFPQNFAGRKLSQNNTMYTRYIPPYTHEIKSLCYISYVRVPVGNFRFHSISSLSLPSEEISLRFVTIKLPPYAARRGLAEIIPIVRLLLPQWPYSLSRWLNIIIIGLLCISYYTLGS